MSDVIYVEPYYPQGVQHILTTGSCHYISFVDDSTVLKYPHFKDGSSHGLDVESAIYKQLGNHPRIIEFKDQNAGGLLLEYATNGSLESYLVNRTIIDEEKLRFAKEIAEGVAYAYAKNVIICDIHVRNVLLDSQLHVKLCDFQGRILAPDGTVLCDGGASENAEAFMPRSDLDSASIQIDIFALGSTIYRIIAGHRLFPHLHTIDDEAEFQRRYRQAEFPELQEELSGLVVRKCWEGRYSSAGELFGELDVLRASLLAEGW
ncbi:hypothetical protein ACJQWK_10301 [Exserohilum turcicum]